MQIWRDDEARLYFLVTFLAGGLITIYNFIAGGLKELGQTMLDAFFQVISILTTTGYVTDDYDIWPTFSKMILLTLFFIGGCSSSTAGGIKCIRIVVAMKMAKLGMMGIYFPKESRRRYDPAGAIGQGSVSAAGHPL